MTAEKLLAKLNECGVELSVVDGDLRCRSGELDIPSDLKREMSQNSSELVALLQGTPRPDTAAETSNERAEQLRSFWASSLPTGIAAIDMPFDRPRPEVRSGQRGEVPIDWCGDLVEAIAARADEADCAPLVFVLAAFKTLVYRYTGRDDIIVGAGKAPGRPASGQDAADWNETLLPIRTNFADHLTFRDVLRNERDAWCAARDNRGLSFGGILEAVAANDQGARQALEQFVVAQVPKQDAAGTVVASSGSNQAELAVLFAPRDNGLVGVVDYDAELFDRSTIERLLANLETLIEAATANPDLPISRLTIVSQTERRQVLYGMNQTAQDFPRDATLVSLFKEQVARTPDAVALICEDEVLSYREFDERTNQLARYLIERRVGPNTPVGLYLERSVEMLVGIYAILKAGGAYMPLDPDYPSERIAFMLEESSPAVVLTQERFEAQLPATSPAAVCLDRDWSDIARQSAEPVALRAAPSDLAYVIYTSGSTGRPKGVMVEHGAICNREFWVMDEYGFHEDDVVIQKFPFGFDASVCELFTPLLCGARLVIARPGGHRDSAYLAEQIAHHGVTTIQIVPSMLELLLDDASIAQCGSLRRVLCGGEALTHALHKRLKSRLPDCRLDNMYGPTEAAINVTAWDCRDSVEHRTIPIGHPVANTQIYVLDSYLEPVPIGVSGELYIGGAQLARGYLNRPDLTAERFIPNPFAQDGSGASDLLYRTGDLCRRLEDGSIEYVDRIDFQVKIRGLRIELGEIEAAIAQLMADPLPVVVSTWTPAPSDVRLVAYIETKRAGALDLEALRERLRRRLPDYMVPQYFVELDQFPITVNGKTDRQKLPAPTEPTVDREIVPVESEAEERLGALWGGVLGTNDVSRTDNFFDCGGHSLLAMKLIGLVEEAFGVRLSFRSLLQSSLAEIAAQLPDTVAKPDSHSGIPIVQRLETGAELALVQEPFWVLHKLDPSNVSDHMWFQWNIEGRLDRSALQGAFDAIVRRHESLRMRVVANDALGVLHVDEPFTMPVESHSLLEVAMDQRDARMGEICTEALRRPFDFSRAPLFRMVLIEVEPDRHMLFCVIQHIIGDGLSTRMLQAELAEHYAAIRSTGAPARLPEFAVQYLDFAQWQRSQLTPARTRELERFWRDALPADLPPLELPTDHPRPAIQTFRGQSVPISLPLALATQLRKACTEEGCSLFVAINACLKILLHRLSGQEDVVFGIPVAMRDVAVLSDLVGLLTNTLPIRTNFAQDRTFREVLRQEQENFIEAIEHKDLPFQQIVRAVGPPRDPSRNPLFQVMIEMTPGVEVELPGLDVTRGMPDGAGAQFDLAFHLTERRDTIDGFALFNTDLFNVETIERMIGHFKTVLEAVADEPDLRVSQIPLLSEPERRTMLVDWNATRKDYREADGLHHVIAEQVARRPDATALVFNDQAISYADLDRRANQLANHLRTLGVGPDAMVGLSVERSLELVIGALGILKAGGAYVPMDPAYPKQRLGYMVEDTGTKVIVTKEHLVADLPPHEASIVCLDRDWDAIGQLSDQLPQSDFHSGQLAYVIFTSGSTGRPKGVMVEHRNVTNFIAAMDDVIAPGLTPEEISREAGSWLAVTSLSFDISVLELFWTLARGFKVVLFDENASLDRPGAATIPALIEAHDVSHMQCVPAMARMMLSDRAGKTGLRALKKLLIGGEAFPGPLAGELNAHMTGDVVNMYGPTETTVWSSTYPASGGENTVPIGRPVANTELYVLDENLEPVPVGVSGELFIGGAGVTRGYVGREDLTKERFIPDRFGAPEGRLYRTGDRVAYRPDGVIEYLGRLDFQVKIRGFRIELGEIEAAIASHANSNATVIVNAWTPDQSDVRLVAYLEENAIGGLTLEELRETLRGQLPDYMVPQHFVELASFPKTSNGKIDRKQLPAPEVSGQSDSESPATAIEKEMAALWQRRLRTERIGRSDNFFDLGGHSLSAVQVAADIVEAFKVPYSPAHLMEKPYLKDTAECVEQLLAGKTRGDEGHETLAQESKPLPVAAATEQAAATSQVVPVPDDIVEGKPRRESRWRGFKNRILQILALYAPGLTTLRVKLHRARGVTIGNKVGIGVGALIETSSPHLVSIGSRVQIGVRSVFIGHFGESTPAASKTQPTIRVEDDVYIGPGVIVLPNVTLGQGSVITAGSVVNTSVPPKTVVQGNPAVPVARCNAPLAWNSHADYMKNLQPLDVALPTNDADANGAKA